MSDLVSTCVENERYAFLEGTLGIFEMDGELFYFEGEETLPTETSDMVECLEDIKRHIKFLQGHTDNPDEYEKDLDCISVDIEQEQDKREKLNGKHQYHVFDMLFDETEWRVPTQYAHRETEVVCDSLKEVPEAVKARIGREPLYYSVELM